MAEKLVQIKDLSISFNNNGNIVDVIKNVNFSIQQGKCLCLVGESGSGKSLSAYAIIDLLPQNAFIKNGEIKFNGRYLTKMKSADKQKVRGNQIGFIFQEPLSALNPLFTVGHQIEESLKLHTKLNKAQRYNKVIKLLKKVRIDNPEQRYKAYPHELSGGQRQRVCIAMALANKCKLLIADEPTTALDVSVQKEILDLIKHLQKEENLAVLFITHDFSVVEEVAQEVAVMQNGQIIEQGSLRKVLDAPENGYTKKLLDSMPGKNNYQIKENNDKIILKIKDLNKSFKSKSSWFKTNTIKAVDNISFDLEKKQTLAIVGESGSGKSTLVRCIARLISADSGEIKFLGKNLTKANATELRKARRNMQMIFQDPLDSLNPRMRIIDSVSEGLIAYKVMPKHKIRPYLEKIFEDCKLKPSDLDKLPSEFSGGQRQRICIAKAIAMKPKLLIADEAVSALDLSVQKRVLGLLNELKEKYDLSILFITHDLRVVKEIADSVLVMEFGKLIEQGATEEVFKKPKNAYTKKLLKAIPGKI
tara:strand:- start:181 stop:1776 length:1596 start_codon:yes stop_codon:yes gene_type:complete